MKKKINVQEKGGRVLSTSTRVRFLNITYLWKFFSVYPYLVSDTLMLNTCIYTYIYIYRQNQSTKWK
jgi:hypothetical protein